MLSGKRMPEFHWILKKWKTHCSKGCLEGEEGVHLLMKTLNKLVRSVQNLEPDLDFNPSPVTKQHVNLGELITLPKLGFRSSQNGVKMVPSA